ncbi:MAG: glycosyltransferase [Fervidicoccus sp.]
MYLDPSLITNYVDIQDLIQINMIILLIKYTFYTIWIVPAYRLAMTFKSWRKNFSFYSVQELAEEIKTIEGKISVLIPARNSENYIISSILSAFNQSVPPKSIYILNDNSTDNTIKKVMNFISQKNGKLKRVIYKDKYIFISYDVKRSDGIQVEINVVDFKEHMGKPSMINEVLPSLNDKVDYVLILDSDTIIERRYIEKMLVFLNRDSKLAGVNGTILLWKPEKEGRFSWFFAKAFRNLASLYYLLTLRFSETVFNSVNSLNGSCSIYKLKPLLEIGGIPTDTYVEDSSTSWHLQLLGYSVAYIPTAYSFTVDPSSPKRFFSKVLRITVGIQKLFLTRLPKLIKKKKYNLLLTSIYTSFGSLPFILMIANTINSIILASLGIYSSSILEKMYEIFQFTPISIILLAFLKYPIIYLILSYVTGVLEVVAAYYFLRIIYKDEKIIRNALDRSKSGLILVPLILWVQSFIALIAFPITVFQILAKKKLSKW